jgi:hypothetical protein
MMLSQIVVQVLTNNKKKFARRAGKQAADFCSAEVNAT